MDLYTYISIESFIRGCQLSASSGALSFRADSLFYAVPADRYQYGLQLLRKAIHAYEACHGLSGEGSKEKVPFFLDHRLKLVGPDAEMFVFPLSENAEPPANGLASGKPMIRLAFDYTLLMEFCLSENLFLMRCKYDEEQNLHTFLAQMDREYSRFFFDDEHSGFAPDSHFFSLLCNACLEVRPPHLASEKAWQLALLREPAEAEYRTDNDRLIPFVSLKVPLACIRQITLFDDCTFELNYNSLVGFLQSMGLPPQHYLVGMSD